MGMFFHKSLYYFNYNLFYTVLHPCHKVMYFHKVGWSQDWIDTAHNIVQMEYKSKYKSRIIERDEENDIEEIAPPISVHFCVNLSPCMSTDIELKQYLRYTPNAHYSYRKSRWAWSLSFDRSWGYRWCFNVVLMWWNEQHAMYPRLLRMALDYLSIPGAWIFLLVAF